ncbi:MAG: helix-turn-helix domain-containing protein [Spirochaetota bacterium]
MKNTRRRKSSALSELPPIQATFRTTVVVAILLVVVLGISLSYVFERNLTNALFDRSVDVLQESARLPGFFTEYSRVVARQVFLDQEIGVALRRGLEGSVSAVRVLDAMREIYGGLSYLRSLYVYVAQSERVYVVSDEDYSRVIPIEALPDASFRALTARVWEHQNFRPVLRQVGITPDPQLDDFVYTFLLYNYIPADRIDFVIAVNFGPEVFMDASGGADVYALSEDGVVQIPAAGMIPLQSISDQAHIARILTSEEERGSFVYRRPDGERYLVAHWRSPETGWVFVSEQSYREITVLPRSLRLTALVLVVAALLLILGFSIASRRRLLLFAAQQKETLASLRARATQLSGMARKKLVGDMLYGRRRLTSSSLGQTASEMLLEQDQNAHFAFLIVKSNTTIAPDESGWTDVENLLEHWLPQPCRIVESIYHRSDVVALLIHAPVPVSSEITPSDRARLGPIARRSQCQFGLTRSVNDLAEIHGLSGDIEYVLHRMFFDPVQLFVTAETRETRSDYVYPEADEKQMLDSLLHGRPEEAKRMIEAMLRSTEPYGRPVFSMVAYKLVHEIRAAMQGIEHSEHQVNSSDLLSQPTAVLSELDRVSDIETLLSEFEAAVDEIAAIIHDSREGRRDRLIATVDSIVADRLFDSSFHLGTLAELVGLNAQYLSRVYREETGESLPRRILTMRLNAVKRRLSQTSDPVRRVISECGLPENAHFYKVFRDATGMTPKQYRTAHQHRGSATE